MEMRGGIGLAFYAENASEACHGNIRLDRRMNARCTSNKDAYHDMATLQGIRSDFQVSLATNTIFFFVNYQH